MSAPASLKLLPVVTPELLETVYHKLPMKPGGAMDLNINMNVRTKFVIDGANVLFACHNGVKTLNKILNQLCSDGSVVTLVLHKRHFNGKLKDSLSCLLNHPFINLIQTPYGVNDDYYSIYIAMKNESYLVTNDKFRDHIYHIDPQIAKWHKQYVVNFSNDGVLNMPVPYSHCIQLLEDTGAIWIPSTDPQWGWGTQVPHSPSYEI
jgi:hypothetical protein